MSYFFECPYCSEQHGVDFNDVQRPIYSETPERECEVCGKEGCPDCQPYGMCEDCQAERNSELDAFFEDDYEDDFYEDELEDDLFDEDRGGFGDIFD
jgi:hypothetical protein